jgi:hypothetical protein
VKIDVQDRQSDYEWTLTSYETILISISTLEERIVLSLLGSSDNPSALVPHEKKRMSHQVSKDS